MTTRVICNRDWVNILLNSHWNSHWYRQEVYSVLCALYDKAPSLMDESFKWIGIYIDEQNSFILEPHLVGVYFFFQMEECNTNKLFKDKEIILVSNYNVARDLVLNKLKDIPCEGAEMYM